jgi:hypothetical protein
MSYAFLVQLRLLYNIPTSLTLKDFDFHLPCSEEEWSADSAEKWFHFHASASAAPTPKALVAFSQLFGGDPVEEIRYSEFGGYVMIITILGVILDKHRLSVIPVTNVDFSDVDVALDSWQKVWQMDPRSHPTGPRGFMGALAFNASAVYRVSTVRRVFDYSRYLPRRSPLRLLHCLVPLFLPVSDSRIKAKVGAINEAAVMDAVTKTLHEEPLPVGPEMIRALASACVLMQINIKYGARLLARTAPLTWSTEHMFYTFEIGIAASD